jgi:hypothetical protein
MSVCAGATGVLATYPFKPLLTLSRASILRRFHSRSATSARKSVTLKNVNSIGGMFVSFR